MFDTIIERRGSCSVKWDAAPQIFGELDILPMWVADMDFPVAEPITRAIVNQAEHGIYGYALEDQSLKQSVVDRVWEKFGWRIEQEWLVFSTGIVHALHMIIKAFTRPGDGVVIQPPVYYPFFSAITSNGCSVIENPLLERDGRYTMDLGQLDRCFRPDHTGLVPRPSRARALLLCSPHNPVGRAWTREELTGAARVARDHGALIISDEIHAELLLNGRRHIPTASLNDDFLQNSITCFSPSKTFNLAGLKASVLIIPNQGLRAAFKERTMGFLSTPCILGQKAMEAAFRYGDPWLAELLPYLETNLDYLKGYFAEHIPEIHVIQPEGTYLVWLDCRKLGMDDQELRCFIRHEAKVGLDDGYLFGTGGSGYQRINIACPQSILTVGLQRIERAVSTWRKV